jgi:multiple sugar transport system ATP-binding protein
MAEIALEGVTKTFPDGTTAVSELDMSISDGELTVLVGPSGCGKTTLLRMVAGLDQPTAGTIRIGETVVNDVAPKARDIAMVFQNYALYPHMSVYDNMAFALRRRRETKAVIDERVRSAATMLGLDEHLRKKPAALSGGQRQRVAMGRAIVREPQAFLMDEPLSNLDAKLRVEMRAEISRIQRELGVTTIFVTHDQTEAMTMGDRVVVMRKGVVQQVDDPQTLFARPANIFVAGFIGSPPMNLVRGRVEAEGEGIAVTAGRLRAFLPREVAAQRPGLAVSVGREVVVGIRPEDFEDAAFAPDDPPAVRLRIAVELRETIGREAYLHFRLDAPPVVSDAAMELVADTDVIAVEALHREAASESSRLIARVDADTLAREGDSVELALSPAHLAFFDIDSGQAI